MEILRRMLGVFLMIAGVIGLLLSLTGLIGLWVLRPRLVNSLNSTITTLVSSIDTSQKVMEITGQALQATVESVDGLSSLLATTAVSVEDTQPVIIQLNEVMGKQLPSTLKAATDALDAAQGAATSLESVITSLDTFRGVMSSLPLLSAYVPSSSQSYHPQKPLADSLGELSQSLKEMPDTFSEMAANIDKADDNLTAIQNNLETMSKSTAQISDSLSEYQSIVVQSQTSMGNLKILLSNVQTNLNAITTWGAIGLGLFFLWLLATQAVIFSQGWEIFHGTAGRMESDLSKPSLNA